MSDLAWTIIAGIVCICIAYGLGLQVGYYRGYKHRYYEDLLKHANNIMEVKTNESN